MRHCFVLLFVCFLVRCMVSCSGCTEYVADGAPSDNPEASFKVTSPEGIPLYFTITSVSGCSVVGSSTYKNISGQVTLPSRVDYKGVQYRVNNIDKYAFSGCLQLQEVILPEGLVEIERSAFSGCTHLQRVVIPSSLEVLGGSAFDGCTALTSLSVAKENKNFDSRGDCNAIIDRRSNVLLVGCQTSRIPEGVSGIGEGAFGGCTGLKKVEVPAGVRSIGVSAFGGCSSLEEVVLPKSLHSVGQFAFANCTMLREVALPDAVDHVRDYTFAGCQ